MLVHYPATHAWHKEISADPLFGFGKNNQTKLKSFLKKLTASTITHTITPISEESVSWFEKVYLENLQHKQNPRPRNVRRNVLESVKRDSYYLLQLLDSGTPVGGLIFFRGDACLSVAYRSFAHEWLFCKQSASPSLYAEYLISEHCFQLGFTKLLHGRDRNPYGHNSQIGVANFKLSAGCFPVMSKTPGEKLAIDLAKVTEDILVFSYPEPAAKRIIRGYLAVSQANLARHEAVLKYADHIAIEVFIRSN